MRCYYGLFVIGLTLFFLIYYFDEAYDLINMFSVIFGYFAIISISLTVIKDAKESGDTRKVIKVKKRYLVYLIFFNILIVSLLVFVKN